MKSVWSLRRRWYSSAMGSLTFSSRSAVAQTSSAVGRISRAGGDVLVVRDRGADTGVLLDDDLVAVAHQLVHAGGGDGHPELVVLDLAGDADLHVDHGPWLRGYYGAYAIHTRYARRTGRHHGERAAEPV